MELQLQQERVETYGTCGEAVVAQDESAETIVPDYCPDMARVIATEGTVFVHSQELREGRAEVTGTVQVNILYTPDGERGVRALEISLPYQAETERRALPDCEEVAAETVIETLEARMLNPRKILTRCRLSTRVTGYRKTTLCLTTDVAADEAHKLEKRRERQTVLLLPQIVRREFQFSDTFTLSSGREGAAELLSTDVETDVTETRIIGNKLICKGVFTVSVLYLTEGNECASERVELPFSHIMDVDGAAEDAPVSARVRLTDADIQIGGDDPEGREIAVSLYLETLAFIRKEMDVELLRDFYSTAWETRYSASPLTVTQSCERQTYRQTYREQLESGITADEVIFIRVQCGTVTADTENGLRVPVTIRALYADEGGAALVSERRTELRCDADIPDGCQVRVETQLPEEPRGNVNERGIEVRFALDFRVETVKLLQTECVTSAELDDDSPKDAADMPSLVLRRMTPDESAWDAAKACNSTVRAILDANCLEDESELPRDTLILIPRKRG